MTEILSCQNCKHFCYAPASQNIGYSEFEISLSTMHCEKGYWSLNPGEGQGTLRSLLNSAPHCPDWQRDVGPYPCERCRGEGKYTDEEGFKISPCRECRGFGWDWDSVPLV